MRKPDLCILMISGAYPPQGGGVATHLQYLVEALRRQRSSAGNSICHIHVVTTGEIRERQELKPNLTLHRFLGNSRHFTARGEIPFEDVVRYCCEQWRRLKPDLIHVHDFEGLQIAAMLKAEYSTPIMLTVHRAPKLWDPTSPQRDVKDLYLRFAQRFGMIDQLVAPSSAYQTRLLAQGFPQEQIAVIHHGVPVRWLASIASRSSLLREFKIPDDAEVVLCPARIDPHKGIDTLIRAAAMVIQQHPHRKLLFVVAGSGSVSERSSLMELANSLGIGEHIRLGAPTSADVPHRDMPTLYRRATICVLPSRQEGFGQVLLEAAVYHTPVIGTNIGGIPDIILPNRTGLLFTTDDAGDLAYQIAQLLCDKEFREALAREAFSQVSGKFSADQMAQLYIREYMRIIEKTKEIVKSAN
jgi:glycosyltransferase involved in cell wall biosynthesis